MEETLRDKLAPKPPVAKQPFLRLATVGGAGVRPGIDLNNSAALLAVMERRIPTANPRTPTNPASNENSPGRALSPLSAAPASANSSRFRSPILQ